MLGALNTRRWLVKAGFTFSRLEALHWVDIGHSSDVTFELVDLVLVCFRTLHFDVYFCCCALRLPRLWQTKKLIRLNFVLISSIVLPRLHTCAWQLSRFGNPPVSGFTSAFEWRRSALLYSTGITRCTTRDQLICADVTIIATSERLWQVADQTFCDVIKRY